MTKPIIAIFALCFCVTLTAGAVAADKKHKEQIKLPAFHKQTVKIDGKDVAIQVRWFKKRLTIGSTDVNRLPECASKTMVIASRYLLNKEYKAFVSLHADKKRAQKLVDFAKKRAKKIDPEKQTKLMASVRHITVLGEVRLGAYYMVVCDLHEQKPPTIGSRFLIRTDDGFRMASPTYYVHKNKAKQPNLKQILAVTMLIEQGKLGPTGKNNKK